MSDSDTQANTIRNGRRARGDAGTRTGYEQRDRDAPVYDVAASIFAQTMARPDANPAGVVAEIAIREARTFVAEWEKSLTGDASE